VRSGEEADVVGDAAAVTDSGDEAAAEDEEEDDDDDDEEKEEAAGCVRTAGVCGETPVAIGTYRNATCPPFSPKFRKPDCSSMDRFS
jgi:hypothetical protein